MHLPIIVTLTNPLRPLRYRDADARLYRSRFPLVRSARPGDAFILRDSTINAYRVNLYQASSRMAPTRRSTITFRRFSQ